MSTDRVLAGRGALRTGDGISVLPLGGVSPRGGVLGVGVETWQVAVLERGGIYAIHDSRETVSQGCHLGSVGHDRRVCPSL